MKKINLKIHLFVIIIMKNKINNKSNKNIKKYLIIIST